MAASPLVATSGLVLPSLNAPHSGWPRPLQRSGSPADVKISAHVGASASHPIADARFSGMASTMSETATLVPSARRLVAPAVCATSTHVDESGSHTVGFWSSARFGKPVATTAAATPDFSRLVVTVTHEPATLRGWLLYAAASPPTISAFSNDDSTFTVAHGS